MRKRYGLKTENHAFSAGFATHSLTSDHFVYLNRAAFPGDTHAMIRTIVVATRNHHKVEEISGILGASLKYLTLRDLPNAPEVVEDGATFAANATKKAVGIAEWLRSNSFAAPEDVWVLADDSGLEVDALNGAPGVHSARFAADELGLTGNSPDAANNAKLLRLLDDVPDSRRTARFRCVIAFTPLLAALGESSNVCLANELELATEIFDGACEGRILHAPRGAHGFGYDPLFVPKGYEQTFAELGEQEKNKLSHRAHALAKLKARHFAH